MKYIVIVPDGMADHPLKELGGKTPLQAARTTNLDFLAKNGTTGMVKTIPSGMTPGSDVGNMSLLGYDPKKYLAGRAALEAASMNLDLKADEVAFRCNLVTVFDNKMEDYSAGHIKNKESHTLIADLNKALSSPEVRFIEGKSYRNLAIIKTNDPKSFLKVKTPPPHDILGKDIKSYLPKGSQGNIILDLMQRSREVLENHNINQVRIDLKENPANMIWLWGQGVKPVLPSFQEKYGLKGGIISAVDLVNGIGKIIGLEIISVPGITGYYDTNYLGKAQYALESLKKNDFVFVHIEAPDEAGHNGDIRAKVEAIEQIDKHIVGTILNHFNEFDDVRIMVLPDHETPIELRTHTDEPVGFVVWGKGIPHDGSNAFSEAETKTKSLVFESGENLMEFFTKKYL